MPFHLVDNDGTLLTNKVQELKLTTLPPGTEVQVCCQLITYPSSLAYFVENCIRRNTGRTPGKERQVQHLLTTYGDIFSIGEAYVLRTDLVQHQMLVDFATALIRQRLWILGPEKERKLEKQIQRLAQ